ncbi:MAG: OB-fold domain-containing protein [Deltaproteobacteria bacterium]|jgi:Holliday junction DNA helicase RuvA
MIGYLEGKVISKEEDRVLLLCHHIGYEILLPGIVMKALEGKQRGDELSLYIYHQQTERQPKPVLIGFNLEVEKEFFQNFISVGDIGPLKAVRALSIPIREIATAIESNDVHKIKQLKGIGARTAQKIIATLQGKMGKFALIREKEDAASPVIEDIENQVIDVLVTQLGHKKTDAAAMVAKALKLYSPISTPEELFEAVYRSQRDDESVAG